MSPRFVQAIVWLIENRWFVEALTQMLQGKCVDASTATAVGQKLNALDDDVLDLYVAVALAR